MLCFVRLFFFCAFIATLEPLTALAWFLEKPEYLIVSGAAHVLDFVNKHYSSFIEVTECEVNEENDDF